MARLGAFACAAVVALSVVEATQAADRLVPSQYATIQAAINAASAGDVVLVERGVYRERPNMLGKAITLRSLDGAALTTIQAPSSAVGPVLTCNSSETNACVVEGFTITGATNGPGILISNASPVFKFCQIKLNFNSSSDGAGVSITGTTGAPKFMDCSFFANLATGRDGGAIAVPEAGAGGTLTCERCTFEENEVVNGNGGGAVFTRKSASFSDCVFRLNRITDSGGNNMGGAIFSSASLALDGCTFDRNLIAHSSDCGVDDHAIGGAIYALGAVTASACVFHQNESRNTPATCGETNFARGGAVGLDSANAASFTDCVFSENEASHPIASCSGSRVARGGAVEVGGSCDPVFTRCDFIGNRAGGCGMGDGGALFYYGGSEGQVLDCSFSACNAGSGGALYLVDGAGPLVARCEFLSCAAAASGGAGGAVRVDSTTAVSTFVDCRFSNCSASVGGAAWINLARPLFDRCVFDHNTAPSGSAVRSFGTTIQTKPSICYSSFCSNSGAEANWVLGLYLDPHPGSPTNHFVADCGLDCNANGILDSVEIDAGLPDCDGDDIPDTCEPDCDGDGVPNACEITAGAADCDSNGVPDTCQGVDADVNHDGTPDLCQGLEFVGLVTELVPAVGPAPGLPAGALCWRVYAAFSTPTSLVSMMYGDSQHPMSVHAPGGFWQLPTNPKSGSGGGDLSSQVECSDSTPGVEFDSYFAINRACPTNPDLVFGGSVDLDGFNSGTGLTITNGAVVATSVDSASLRAGADGRILLLQLTTLQPEQPTGFLNLVGYDSGGDVWQAFDMAIPAPALVDCDANGTHDAIDIASGAVSDCDHDGIPDSCQWSPGNPDCDGDGIGDYCELATGSSDINSNGRPDECDCLGDVDGNGAVNVDDLIDVVSTWGDPVFGERDLDGDHVVNGGDLVLVLNNWGSCIPPPPPGAG